MTIGERIKYCRKRIHMTQNDLAEATGIHPVTIRKYETNKIVPQPEQIKRLCRALCVGYTALAGLESANLDLVTQGDVIGFLMQLKQKNLIKFEGSRNPDTKRIDRDSLRITISPMIAHLLTLSIKDSLDTKDIPGEKIEIQLPEYISGSLTAWEKGEYIYKEVKQLYEDSHDESIKAHLDDIAESLAKLEIQVQTNTYLLDESIDNPILDQWEQEDEQIHEKLSKESKFAKMLKDYFFD